MEEWVVRKSYDWITQMFEAPAVRVGTASSRVIRDHVRNELSAGGWALDFPVEAECSLTVTAKRRDMAFQVQTGNVSRAAYDLLKLQYLYSSRQIETACLAVPAPEAAQSMGSNLANSRRLADELSLFSRQITLPLILISFA